MPVGSRPWRGPGEAWEARPHEHKQPPRMQPRSRPPPADQDMKSLSPVGPLPEAGARAPHRADRGGDRQGWCRSHRRGRAGFRPPPGV